MYTLKKVLGFLIVLGLMVGTHILHAKLKWPIALGDLIFFPLAIFAPIQCYFKLRLTISPLRKNTLTWKQLIITFSIALLLAMIGGLFAILEYLGALSNAQHQDCFMHSYTAILLSFEFIFASLFMLYIDIFRHFIGK